MKVYIVMCNDYASSEIDSVWGEKIDAEHRKQHIIAHGILGGPRKYENTMRYDTVYVDEHEVRT